MKVVADFINSRGVHVVCRRPDDTEITPEERKRREQHFARTAYKLMCQCKERLIAEGKEDKLAEYGLDEI